MRPARTVLALILMGSVAMPLAACGDDDDGDDGTTPQGPFSLVFAGDASFQGAHGGQEIHAAVVRPTSSSPVVASQTATVSASADPSFSFTFPGVLEQGEAHQVHYWIDSNFQGGQEGVCGPMDDDHQWSVVLQPASDDVTHTEAHMPAETESVCSTFSFDLTFAGDASFQAPHGGQPVHFAVVRASDGLVVAREESSVASNVDPAFEFDLAGVLVRGAEYNLDYWIDSNFQGGAVGVCDAPVDDHQWRRPAGPVTQDVSRTEIHEPAEITDVCSSFQ